MTDAKQQETTEDDKKVQVSAPLLLQSIEPKVAKELEYGFLKLLEGNWANKDNVELGLNIISLPPPGTQPKDKVGGGGDGGFILVDFNYSETLKFTLKGSARNRGGLNEQLNTIVEYNQVVKGAQRGQKEPTVQHVENGMYLFLDNISLNKGGNSNDTGDGQYKPDFNYVRSGTVPHGNSLMLFGNELKEIDGPPDFESIKGSLLSPVSDTMGAAEVQSHIWGYTDDFTTLQRTPFDALNDAIKDQNIIKTRTLSLSSKNGDGAITNTSFIKKYADATEMDFVLWLETVKDKDSGNEFLQLQYVQKIKIAFDRTEKTDTLIHWPHITVNTLRLQ